MMDFLRAYQTSIMFVLSGICGMIAFFTCITKYPSRRRKTAQLVMALSAMLLLITEILGEKYYGDTSSTGYWMVRICNFSVYMTTLVMIHAFVYYLADMIKVDLKLPVPKQLKFTSAFIFIGEFLVILTPFTGLYYTFDERNCYHRSALYPISYLFPLLAIILLFVVVLKYRRRMRTGLWITLILFTLIPLTAAGIQYFYVGIYLTDMAIIGMVVMLYVFTLVDTKNTLNRAREREMQLLKEKEETTRDLFSQTAVALVSAIDAKDAYTQGHSARVAEYSRKIAEISGKSEQECDQIYFAALLHDVGKIGIPDHIINKNGKLTPEEYETIQSHPVIGDQILSKINHYSYLSEAARHHHERMDGKGYPDGLKGEEIPEPARIISVADAYDAMTSNRSYRSPLTQEEVRRELERCSGTQFDPAFAEIMIRLMDQDKDYLMREK